MDIQTQAKAIEALAFNEELIKKLYEEYALKFPEHNGFWLELAKEEQIHANVIRAWLSKAESGALVFEESRFRDGSIMDYANLVNGYLEELRDNDISIRRAANVAVGLEESLIEKKFFEEWGGDDPDFRLSLNFLNEACQKHLVKTREFRDFVNKG